MAICPSRQKDQLRWIGTKNGEFSVRSVYHLAKDSVDGSRESCSNEEPMTNLWRTMWRIRGHRVVKTFLWKACSNILPTKENLQMVGVVARMIWMRRNIVVFVGEFLPPSAMLELFQKA
jgi:hypothetical protein